MVNESNYITNTQDPDMERGVLGAIMLEHDIYNTISDDFHLGLFTNSDHQNIAKVIIGMKNQGKEVDLLTVSQAMKKKDYFSETFGPYHLSQLTNRIASTANTHHHIRLLQELFMKREVVRITDEASRKATAYHADIFEVIDEAERGIGEITAKILVQRTQTSEELMKESLARNKLIVDLNGALLGISTGFRKLDELTGGWQNGKLVVLAGDTSMGKSTLAFDCVLTAALAQIPVGVFSLEMPAIEQYNRLQAKATNFSLTDITNKGIKGERLQRFIAKCQPLAEAPIYIDDTSYLSIFQLKNRARRWKRAHNIKLLVIDYLQLMEGERKGNREQEVATISRGLKGLAKELDIPIIALSQLSREIKKRADKEPQLSDLRESGSIEQDADIVAFVFRPEYYGITEGEGGEDLKDKAKILIKKHRGGPLGSVKLDFLKEPVKFVSEGMTEEVGQGSIIF